MKMLTMQIFSIFQLVFLVSLSADDISIKAKFDTQGKFISPLFFGMNSLYWIDDDKSRNNPYLLSELKSLNISVIRFPGGEVGDNYNWTTNTLNDDNYFPFSKNVSDPLARMDFDEFIVWKEEIGAKADIVVNLEQGFIDGDINKAANLAAEWVKYANIDKQYNIKYWEIGNESYHLTTRYATTSLEYAKALKLFSQKMKAVDPSIKIGAIGPYNPRDIPLVDILSPSELKDFRSRKTAKAKTAFKKRYKHTFVKNLNLSSWWDTVLKYAGNSFDFAVIHRYTPKRKINLDMKKQIKVKKQVIQLRNFLQKKLHREIPIAITEYNVAGKSQLKGIYYSLTMAEMIGNYLESGAFMTNYWPVRKKDNRTLIGVNDFSEKPVYEVFKAISNNLGDKIVPLKVNGKGVYAFSSIDTQKLIFSLFIINKKEGEQVIKINLLPYSSKFLSCSVVDKTHNLLHKSNNIPIKDSKGIWKTKVLPLSMTILKFKFKFKDKDIL